jgi:hypothetical protein
MWISRPAVEGQLDNLLLNVDEACIFQPPLGEFGVHAHRATKAIHGIQKFIRPLHDARIAGDDAALETRVPVYLDLFEIAVVRFKMPSQSVNKTHRPMAGDSPEDLGVNSGPITDATIESAHMNEIPRVRFKILPPVFHILLQKTHVGGDAGRD